MEVLRFIGGVIVAAAFLATAYGYLVIIGSLIHG